MKQAHAQHATGFNGVSGLLLRTGASSGMPLLHKRYALARNNIKGKCSSDECATLYGTGSCYAHSMMWCTVGAIHDSRGSTRVCAPSMQSSSENVLAYAGVKRSSQAQQPPHKSQLTIHQKN